MRRQYQEQHKNEMSGSPRKNNEVDPSFLEYVKSSTEYQTLIDKTMYEQSLEFKQKRERITKTSLNMQHDVALAQQ